MNQIISKRLGKMTSGIIPFSNTPTTSTQQTITIKVDPGSSTLGSDLSRAVDFLRQGNVVAFPTETVYGLGANAFNSSAVSKIFAAKGRPSDNPLIVHIGTLAQLNDLADASFLVQESTLLEKLFHNFWPGPLTILFPKSERVPDVVTAGLKTVAVRMPAHPVALALLRESKLPIAAPSANLSGRPSPTRASHVLADLGGRIPCIVDGGSAQVGLESTVIDFTSKENPLILRPGGVTLEQLREILPNIQVYEKKHNADLLLRPSTPGLKYVHYSPRAPVILFEPLSSSLDFSSRLRDFLSSHPLPSSTRIGVILTTPRYHIEIGSLGYQAVTCQIGGEALETNLSNVAEGLFHSLRELDEKGCDRIFVEGVTEEDCGLAIMNRLRKAATIVVNTQ